MSNLTKSVREFLLGSVSDFTDACGIPHLVTNSNLTSLIVALANYQEEGTKLLPEVYLCADLRSMLQIIPNFDYLHIGVETQSTKALTKALKKCAPLARHGWHIYIESAPNSFSYGLFRGSMNPISISANQTLFSGSESPNTSYVNLCQVATGCIEIKSSNGSSRTIILNDKPDTLQSPDIDLKHIVDAICSKVTEKNKDTSRNFIKKTLQLALNESHGAIIAVSNSKNVPKFLTDGIALQAPIDFPDLISQYQLDKQFQIEHHHKLVANAALVRGMICSDGITVFDKKGRVLAYNCFVSAAKRTAAFSESGGARTRAYQTLCEKINKGLSAAYVQSQDGWTKFQG